MSIEEQILDAVLIGACEELEIEHDWAFGGSGLKISDDEIAKEYLEVMHKYLLPLLDKNLLVDYKIKELEEKNRVIMEEMHKLKKLRNGLGHVED